MVYNFGTDDPSVQLLKSKCLEILSFAVEIETVFRSELISFVISELEVSVISKKLENSTFHD